MTGQTSIVRFKTMIDEVLQVNHARKVGLPSTESDVDNAFLALPKIMNLDLQGLKRS